MASTLKHRELVSGHRIVLKKPSIVCEASIMFTWRLTNMGSCATCSSCGFFQTIFQDRYINCPSPVGRAAPLIAFFRCTLICTSKSKVWKQIYTIQGATIGCRFLVRIHLTATPHFPLHNMQKMAQRHEIGAKPKVMNLNNEGDWNFSITNFLYTARFINICYLSLFLGG